MILPPAPRRLLAALASVFVNAAFVVSLARLAAPEKTEDEHEAHRVRPSVVEPPPPAPSTSGESSGAPASSPLPAAPPAPDLELPAAPELGDPSGLSGLGDLGGLGLEGAGGGLELGPPGPAEGAPDVPPRLAVPPDLARYYPSAARRRELEGTTLLALEVGPEGEVRSARVLRADPPGVFDDAALRAARELRFEPAERDGQPVAGATRLELEWKVQK